MSKRDEIADIIEDETGTGSREHSLKMADRILACLAEPTNAMIEAAFLEWFRWALPTDPDLVEKFRAEMRDALVAAGRAMGGDNGKN